MLAASHVLVLRTCWRTMLSSQRSWCCCSTIFYKNVVRLKQVSLDTNYAIENYLRLPNLCEGKSFLARLPSAGNSHASNQVTRRTFYFNFPCIYARYRLSEIKSGVSRSIQKTDGDSGVQRLLHQDSPKDGRLVARAGATTLVDGP